MKKVLIYFLIAFAGGVVAIGLYKLMEDTPRVTADVPALCAPEILVRQTAYAPSAPMSEPDFEAAATLSVNAVVHIKTTFQRKSLVYDDFFNLFNPYNGQSPHERSFLYEAMGSGVVISPDGYIVTNNHVTLGMYVQNYITPNFKIRTKCNSIKKKFYFYIPLNQTRPVFGHYTF